MFISSSCKGFHQWQSNSIYSPSLSCLGLSFLTKTGKNDPDATLSLYQSGCCPFLQACSTRIISSGLSPCPHLFIVSNQWYPWISYLHEISLFLWSPVFIWHCYSTLVLQYLLNIFAESASSFSNRQATIGQSFTPSLLDHTCLSLDYQLVVFLRL